MDKNKKLRIAYLLIGILTFCYVFIRAFRVGITYDEAYTLAEFVPLPVMDIINYSKVVANNHITNTLLIKLFFSFGNDSLFVARLPNVLALILYLYFAYKLTSRNLSSFVGITCFLLLIVNPFVLDFFGLARGYGLGFAFMMAALYCAVENIKQFDRSLVTKSIVFASLSVISNFSMLNFWVVLVFVLNIVPILQKDKIAFRKTLTRSVVLMLILAAILYEPVRKLKMNGALFYGGDNDFYTDTLVSVTKYSMYTTDVTPWVYVCLNVFLIIIIGVILASFFCNRMLITPKTVLITITILCILSVIVQHYLLGTLYLIDRTALFFYLLLILSFSFAINDFSKVMQSVVGTLVLGGFLFNFALNGNLYKTVLWSFDAHTAEILEQMNEKGKRENRILKFDYTWLVKSSVNYYTNRNKYPYLENVKDPINYDAVNPDADFYIFLSKSVENTGYEARKNKIHDYNKTVLMNFPSENIVVYKDLQID